MNDYEEEEETLESCIDYWSPTVSPMRLRLRDAYLLTFTRPLFGVTDSVKSSPFKYI